MTINIHADVPSLHVLDQSYLVSFSDCVTKNLKLSKWRLRETILFTKEAEHVHLFSGIDFSLVITGSIFRLMATE